MSMAMRRFMCFKVMGSDKIWLPSNASLNYLCDAVELAHSYLKTSKVEKKAIVFNGSNYTILFALKDWHLG